MASTIYTVEKLAPGRWQIMRFDHGRTIGTRLGTYETRSLAVECAKRLAGRSGVGTGRSAPLVQLFEREMSANSRQSTGDHNGS